MGEPFPRPRTPGPASAASSRAPSPPAQPQPQFMPMPMPMSVPMANTSFASLRSKHPANLHMDALGSNPPYERAAYSPTPAASPTHPPPLPSPLFFPPRQRAPSLLRHAAPLSPLNSGFPRAEQTIIMPPTFLPMARQASLPGTPTDPRTFFNPLASNPVNHNGPYWTTSREEMPPGNPQQRPRGQTSPVQQDYAPHPPLRAATSIPDCAQRASDIPNPSGAYRPNRGGANWSHNDQYRHFRPDESHTSLRSAWTNASSSFVASGTERSSMATGRSSVSLENHASANSLEKTREDDGEDSSYETGHEDPRFDDPSYDDPSCDDASYDDDDDFMSVEDVIDSYCYDEDIEEEGDLSIVDEDYSRLSSSPAMGVSDAETPGLSQTLSQSDRAYSPLTPDRYSAHDMSEKMLNAHPTSPHTSQEGQENLKLTHDNMPYSPTSLAPTEEAIHTTPTQEQHCTISGAPRQGFGEIYKDLQQLPPFPKKKGRLSRHDWAEIHAYSRKNSRGSVNLLDQFNNANPGASSELPTLLVHNPPIKEANPLPEVDEDDAYPRRASTSVFDRRSTLLQFTKALASPSPGPDPRTEYFNLQPTDKRPSGQNAAISPVSPMFPTNQTPWYRQPTPKVVERDRYGFKKITDRISESQYDDWYRSYEPYVERRRAKWVTLMEKNHLPTTDPKVFPAHGDKIKRYARKGFPPEWRGAMWWYYANGQKKLDQMQGLYASLVARVDQELNKDDREAIERDLDRTFPDNIHFRPDRCASEMQDASPQAETAIVKDLREVLQCFALNNPGIGYCQSLNFIAGLLLLFLKQDNEKVFVLLTIITQYHLPGAHARNLANTEVNVLMMLIKDYLPKVWNSINDTDLVNNGMGAHAHPSSKFQRQPTVALSCTSWFMSLFVGVLPIEVVLRVWDAFLYEGPRALFRYALAIFKLGEPEIKHFHPGDGELFMTVQNLPRACLDPNVLHDIAFVKKGFGSLSQTVVDQKRLFWQQQLAIERKGSTTQPVPGIRRNDSDTGDEVKKRGHGLRRKASRSRRFFKKEKDMPWKDKA